ncbi:MAG: SWIM zinc finger domain-containing protein [Symploca sp. SIO1B1]|nr:SWIM zinc finger domain-containing protein [Symploca sp. SIO1B1]
MSIPELKESLIRNRATDKVFQRGEQYYHSGAVLKAYSRGNTIQATVEGNEVEPYRVNLQIDKAGIKQANCTCAYSSEGWCEHIVATALLCLRQPETIEERPSLEQLLDQLNFLQTQGLIQELVAMQPELIDDIDDIVSQISQPTLQPVTKAKKAKRQTSVDPQPYRSQVQSLMGNALHYWEEGWDSDPIAEELPDIVEQAKAFIEQGDGNSALVILEAITQACAEDWDEIVEYGGDSDYLMSLLDPMWAEAILSAEFQPGEEVDLQVNLENWQDRLGGTFDLSSAALRQGWDDLVLQGESIDSWQDNPPDEPEQLTRIRLCILERQQRYEEYLNLARAEAILPEYLTMLIRLGQIQEVMAQKNRLTCTEQALEVAQALREKEAIPEALEIAQYGLTLPESIPSYYLNMPNLSQYQPLGIHRYQLADWTSNLAEGLGEQKAALAARIEAFKARPSFPDYQKVNHLAGENWLTLQGDLLEYLRQCDSWIAQDAQVNIFLHEDLIDDAIAVLGSYGSHSLEHRVMDAAISYRPEWVIEKALHHAESIMNRGKAKAYDEAVEWLRKARAAYLQSGKQSEWSSYRTQLMKTHARKYKLMGLLKPLN